MDHPPQAASPQIHRRSTRLTISIPVTIRGKDADGKTFMEKSHSVSVSKHGGTIETASPLKAGMAVSIENPKLGKTAQASVVLVMDKLGPSGLRQVAVALTEPQNIWGIDFPPFDWEQPGALTDPTAERKASVVQSPPDQPSEVAFARPLAPPDRPERAPTAAPGKPATPAAPSLPVTPPAVSPASDASKVLEECDAALRAAVTRFVKQLEAMTEARTKLTQEQLDKLADETREALRKELEELATQSVAFTKEQLRKQVRAELAAGTQQLQETRAMMEEVLSALREKVAALLATIEAPISKPAPDSSKQRPR